MATLAQIENQIEALETQRDSICARLDMIEMIPLGPTDEYFGLIGHLDELDAQIMELHDELPPRLDLNTVWQCPLVMTEMGIPF